MSSATPVLAITTDSELLGLLRSTIRDQLGQTGRIVVAGSVEEACPLLKAARPRLVVVHLSGDSGRYEQLDQLLWATSVVSRPTPIVVIAERYRIDQATMMYRMGVSEYVAASSISTSSRRSWVHIWLPRQFSRPKAARRTAKGWAAANRAPAPSAQVV